MCTVTVITSAATHRPSSAQGPSLFVRAVCNRDESRSRSISLPPTLARSGQQHIIHPTDPQSGGTWIGASDIGLAACLLNCNPGHSTPAPQSTHTGRPSRGIIVPAALAQDSIQNAIDASAEHANADMPPFTLLVFNQHQYATMQWNGRTVTTRPAAPLDRPIMLTSSGLGDNVVTPDRQNLFNAMFTQDADHRIAQDLYHTHHSPKSPHTSVLMSRDDARTVSRTTLTLNQRSTTCEHINLSDQLAPITGPSAITLRLRGQLANVQ